VLRVSAIIPRPIINRPCKKTRVLHFLEDPQ